MLAVGVLVEVTVILPPSSEAPDRMMFRERFVIFITANVAILREGVCCPWTISRSPVVVHVLYDIARRRSAVVVQVRAVQLPGG